MGFELGSLCSCCVVAVFIFFSLRHFFDCLIVFITEFQSQFHSKYLVSADMFEDISEFESAAIIVRQIYAAIQVTCRFAKQWRRVNNKSSGRARRVNLARSAGNHPFERFIHK